MKSLKHVLICTILASASSALGFAENDYLEQQLRNQPGFQNLFILRSFSNKPSFFTSTQFSSRTFTNSFTNVLSSNVSFDTSFEFFSTQMFRDIAAEEWVGKRSAYLQDTFGISPADSLAQAQLDLQSCQASDGGCSDFGLFTNFDVEIVDTEYLATDISSDVQNETTVTTETSQNGGRTTTTTTTTDRTTTTTDTTETTTFVNDTTDVSERANSALEDTVEEVEQRDTRRVTDEVTVEESSESVDDVVTVDTETTERKKKKTKWKFDIAPYVFFNMKTSRQVINGNPQIQYLTRVDHVGDNVNITSSAANTRTVQVAGVNRSLVPELEFDPNGGPYLVKEVHDISFGLGLSGVAYQKNAESPLARYGAVVFGIGPIFGRNYLSQRLAQNRQELESLESLRIPRSHADVANWKLGDQVTLKETKGLSLFLGVSYYGLINLAKPFIFTEAFNIEVKKLDNDNLFQVQYALAKSYSDDRGLNAILSAPIASISYQELKQLEKGWVFTFDLNQPEARDAFDAMIRGENADIKPAQEIAFAKVAGPEEKSVQPIQKFKAKADIDFFNIYIGIPLAITIDFQLPHLSYSKGEILQHKVTDSYRKDHADGTFSVSSSDAEYGVYLENKTTRGFVDSKLRNFGFYAVDYTIQDEDTPDDNPIRKQFAAIGYSYEVSDAGYYDIVSGTNDIIRHTGMKEELDVTIDQSHYLDPGKQRGDWGYNLEHGFFKSELAMELNQKVTDTLINIGKSPAARRELRRYIIDFSEAYFGATDLKNFGRFDRANWYLCGTANGRTPYKDCIGHLRRKTQRAADGVIEALADMAVSVSADRKQFVQDYAEFGRHMLSNVFAFRALVERLKGDDMLTMKYRVSGENIKTYGYSRTWPNL